MDCDRFVFGKIEDNIGDGKEVDRYVDAGALLFSDTSMLSEFDNLFSSSSNVSDRRCLLLPVKSRNLFKLTIQNETFARISKSIFAECVSGKGGALAAQ